MPQKAKSVVGTTISNWLVLEQCSIPVTKHYVCNPNTHGTMIMLKAKCIHCDNVVTQPKRALEKSKGSCANCINLRSCPYGDVTESYLAKVRQRAKAKKWEYSVSTKYLSELFRKQNKRCVYTGRQLEFGTATNFRNGHQTASLDRIDSAKGYVEDNVQWVHKKVQPMKLSMSHDDFIALCHEISNNAKPKGRTS